MKHIQEELQSLLQEQTDFLNEFKEKVLEIPIAKYTQQEYRVKVLQILLDLYKK